jgi:hypothetical protein
MPYVLGEAQEPPLGAPAFFAGFLLFFFNGSCGLWGVIPSIEAWRAGLK